MNTINEFIKYGSKFQAQSDYVHSDDNRENNRAQKTINPPFIIESLISLASLSLSEDRIGEAKDYYIKALAIARSSGAPNLEIRPLLGLSSLALECNNDKQARDYYRKALFIAENSRSLDIKSELNLHQLSLN